MRRWLPLLLVLLAGCGSESPADLPAPAGPPASPQLTVKPAGVVRASAERPSAGPARVDRDRDRLIVGSRSVVTCREPVGLATLSRGARIAVLCGRAREVEVFDAKRLKRLGSVPAGIGPTAIASDRVDVFYVVDAVGGSLLVFHQEPLELLRRVHLGGGPYAIAFDRARWGLWITLNGANQLVNYAAGIRPVLRRSYPSIRGARSVVVGRDAVSVLSGTQAQTLALRAR